MFFWNSLAFSMIQWMLAGCLNSGSSAMVVNEELQDSLCQGGPSWLDAASAPIPVGGPLPALATTGDPPTLAGSFGSVVCGVTAPSLWVLAHRRFWLCLQDCSLCFPQCCGSPVIKFCWPSRPDSLGIPSPFVRSLGWEARHGVLNFQNSGNASLVLLFSILWFTHLASIGCYFIMIAPLLRSLCDFFFVFGCGVFFWWVPASSCQWLFNI